MLPFQKLRLIGATPASAVTSAPAYTAVRHKTNRITSRRAGAIGTTPQPSGTEDAQLLRKRLHILESAIERQRRDFDARLEAQRRAAEAARRSEAATLEALSSLRGGNQQPLPAADADSDAGCGAVALLASHLAPLTALGVYAVAQLGTAESRTSVDLIDSPDPRLLACRLDEMVARWHALPPAQQARYRVAAAANKERRDAQLRVLRHQAERRAAVFRDRARAAKDPAAAAARAADDELIERELQALQLLVPSATRADVEAQLSRQRDT
jgi:hypothetical protein